MQETVYTVGTLVKHLYFNQGMGIVTESDGGGSSAFTIHWFDLNEDRREMEWEIISLEEWNDEKV